MRIVGECSLSGLLIGHDSRLVRISMVFAIVTTTLFETNHLTGKKQEKMNLYFVVYHKEELIQHGKVIGPYIFPEYV